MCANIGPYYLLAVLLLNVILPFSEHCTAYLHKNVGRATYSRRFAIRSDMIDGQKWDLHLKSPCKLNLFLRILGRKPNGFHDLASLFQTVTLSDDLMISRLPEGAAADQMTCSDRTLEVTSDNLVIRALDLMRRRTHISNQYFKVFLNKKVPKQAGLGGGSSNAATAMHAFNVLCGYPASQAELLQWSGEIGSDISFFFSSGTAYCTGRGEIVENLPLGLPDAENVRVHIFKPSKGLSTRLVFQSLDLAACCSTPPEQILSGFRERGTLISAASGQLINDLETPAFANVRMLEHLKNELARYKTSGMVEGVMMTGSGTSVFALSSSRSAELPIEEILDKFPSVQYFPCGFVSRENNLHSWYEP